MMVAKMVLIKHQSVDLKALDLFLPYMWIQVPELQRNVYKSGTKLQPVLPTFRNNSRSVTCFIPTSPCVLVCFACPITFPPRRGKMKRLLSLFIPCLLKNGRRRGAVKMFWEGTDLGSLKCQSVRWGSSPCQAVTEIGPPPPTSLTLLILQSCYG